MSLYPYPFDEDEEERQKRFELLSAENVGTPEQTPMSEMSTRDAIAAAYDKQHPYGGYATMTGPLGDISYYDDELNKPKEIVNQPNNRYIQDCSPASFVKNFITASKDTQIPKTLTTGIKPLDAAIESRLTKNIPVLGKLVKAANLGPQIGANIARAQIAMKKSCLDDDDNY